MNDNTPGAPVRDGVPAHLKDRLFQLVVSGEATQAAELMKSFGVTVEPSAVVPALAMNHPTEDRVTHLQAWFLSKRDPQGAMALVRWWGPHLDRLGKDILKRLDKRIKKAPPPDRWSPYVEIPRATCNAVAWRVMEDHSATITDPVEAWVLSVSIAELKKRRSLPDKIIPGKLALFLPSETMMWLLPGMTEVHVCYYLSFRMTQRRDQ